MAGFLKKTTTRHGGEISLPVRAGSAIPDEILQKALYPSMTSNRHTANRTPWLTATAAVGLSALLFALVALRVFNVGMTGPEVSLLDGPLQAPWRDIALMKGPSGGDTLFLLLAKAVLLVTGPADWAFRLPSLLGCFLFLTGLGLTANRLFSGWGRMLGILTVGFNPYTVDALGLAQGESLALGLSMLGLGSIMTALRGRPGSLRFWPCVAAVLCFDLSVYARVAFWPCAMAAVTVLVCATVFAALTTPNRRGVLRVIGQILAIAACAVPLAWGFFRFATVETAPPTANWQSFLGLAQGTIYGAYPTSHPIWLLLAWVAATVLIMPFALGALWRNDRGHFAAVAALTALTALTVGGFAMSAALGHLLPLPPADRPIVLVPLIGLTALSLIALLSFRSPSLVVAGGIVGILIPAWLGLHGLLAANLGLTYDHRADAATRDLVIAAKTWAARLNDDSGSAPVRLNATDADLARVAEHYRRRMAADILAPVTVSTGTANTDGFLLTHERDNALESGEWRVVARSRLAGTVLLTPRERDGIGEEHQGSSLSAPAGPSAQEQ